MKKAVIILLIGAAAAAAYYFLIGNEKPANEFRTTGIIEALEVDIESKVAGRLTYIGFREGDRVSPGELVATVDQAEARALNAQAQSALATAKSALASGYDALDNARARHSASVSDTKRAEAQIQSAKADLTKADKDLARAKELFDRGVISSSDLDLAVTGRDTAKAALDATEASLGSAKATEKAQSAVVSGAESDIKTLKARVKEAESALGVASVHLEDTNIYSPVDAVVDYRYVEQGETVSPGMPILTLVDDKDKWARIDVDERFIGRIKTGQKAVVSLEYMPDRTFSGTVYDIGREGDFAVERDVTRGRQDIRTFRTRIHVDDPDGVLKPGMTVIVTLPYQ